MVPAKWTGPVITDFEHVLQSPLPKGLSNTSRFPHLPRSLHFKHDFFVWNMNEMEKLILFSLLACYINLTCVYLAKKGVFDLKLMRTNSSSSNFLQKPRVSQSQFSWKWAKRNMRLSLALFATLVTLEGFQSLATRPKIPNDLFETYGDFLTSLMSPDASDDEQLYTKRFLRYWR